MVHSLKSRYVLIVLAVAIVVAFISAKPLASANAWVVIPWGALAIVFGIFAKTKKEALVVGALFGFAVSYAYLWFNDTSRYTLAKIVFLMFLILLPSAFGLLCGLCMSWLGWVTKTTLRTKPIRK